MSRCFPFPPPGYARHSDALIDSIKILSVSKKDKKDRKKKDKESKEKRREKKDKKKDRKGKEVTPSHHDSNAIVGKEFKLIEQTMDCVQQKGAYYENEQLLERSDITEEHDQPVACCSDSTQSSSKRKRSISPSPSTHNHGTVKRIRFSFSQRKHTESEQSKSEDQLVFTSKSVGAADSSSQVSYEGNYPLPRDTNAERYQLIHCEESQVLGANNGVASNIRQKDGTASNMNLIEDEGMKMVSEYNSLFQNWVPPSLPSCDGFNLENDWLFSSEPREERPISKTGTHATGALRCSGTSLWPRAQYLPEVETYALPYVVPF